MRAKAIAKYGLPELEFSEVYPFFWDQLEKSNLFLQSVIDTAKEPMSGQTVEWLFRHPLSDGGTFTGVADIVSKSGLVPIEAMPETYSSANTARMAQLISLKLKEFGLKLRDMVAAGSRPAELQAEKTLMLGTVYRMLSLTLGTPPADFDYDSVDGISSESKEKLKAIRPLSVGQAMRISGVRVSDIAVLSVAVRSRERG